MGTRQESELPCTARSLQICVNPQNAILLSSIYTHESLHTPPCIKQRQNIGSVALLLKPLLPHGLKIKPSWVVLP